jgi:hypothetical protein
MRHNGARLFLLHQATLCRSRMLILSMDINTGAGQDDHLSFQYFRQPPGIAKFTASSHSSSGQATIWLLGWVAYLIRPDEVDEHRVCRTLGGFRHQPKQTLP